MEPQNFDHFWELDVGFKKPIQHLELKWKVIQFKIILNPSHDGSCWDETGVFIYPWMVDFSGKFIGKYTTFPWICHSDRNSSNEFG